MLQWFSEGVLPTGRPIKYRGVSILTFKGYKVATFTTYYDSAAFVTPATETPKPVAAGSHLNNEGGN